ncbi:MAG: hypothetical protein WBG43_02185 [Marinifilaceae bacterium]
MKRISLAVLIIFSICLFACKSYKEEFNLKKTELNKEKEISKGKDALISGLEAEKNRLNTELIKLGETAKVLEKEKAVLLERIIKLTNDYSSSKEEIIKLQSTQNILEERLSQSANEKAALLVQQAKLEDDLLSVKDEALRKLTIDQLIKIFEANIKLIGNAGSNDLKLVTTKLKAIEAREKAVLTAEELLKTKRDLLDANTKKLENRKATLNAESISLNKRENDLKSLKAFLDKQKAELAARGYVNNADLAKYQKDIEALRKAKESFEKDKLTYDVKIKKLEASVKDWESKCSEKEKSFIAKDAELKKIEKELEFKKGELAAEKLKTLNLNNNIVELNNTIKLKEKELAIEKEKANTAGIENTKKIKVLEVSLHELKTQRTLLNAEIQQLKEKVSQAEAANTITETKIVGLRNDIQKLENEKAAWGITRESLNAELANKTTLLENEKKLLIKAKSDLEEQAAKHSEEFTTLTAKIAELQKKIADAEISKKFYISKEVWLKRNSLCGYIIGELFNKESLPSCFSFLSETSDVIHYAKSGFFSSEFTYIGVNKKTNRIYSLQCEAREPNYHVTQSYGFRHKVLDIDKLKKDFCILDSKYFVIGRSNITYHDDYQSIILVGFNDGNFLTITNFAVERGEEPLYTK